MRHLGILAILAMGLLTIGIAWAAVSPTSIDTGGRWSKSGIWIGTTSTETAVQANRAAKSLGGSATIDFTAVTITCVDSSGITVTGALANDVCQVGPPAAATANLNFSCYVSAADTVKVRACAAGTAADAASGIYTVRLIRNGS